MNIFSLIFDVFSKRHPSSSTQKHIIPQTTRNRIIMWCQEIFGNSRPYIIGDDYRREFWQEIHRFLQYRHGKFQLASGSHSEANFGEDIGKFLNTCSGEEFIDFIEYIFRVNCLFRVKIEAGQLVEEVNQFFQQDNLPYFLTGFVTETKKVIAEEYPFFGQEVTRITTLAYPKIVLRENEVTHQEIIAPTLTLLHRLEFKNANTEFLEALEDYRKGDFGDCLTKCGSAFESVMKILCQKKGWPYHPTDTASTLLKTILTRSKLENYFESPLLITATLRNRLSKSHGAGPHSKIVEKHLAKYALNATASSILLLVEETEI